MHDLTTGLVTDIEKLAKECVCRLKELEEEGITLTARIETVAAEAQDLNHVLRKLNHATDVLLDHRKAESDIEEVKRAASMQHGAVPSGRIETRPRM